MFAYFKAPIGWTELLRRTLKETLEDNCLGLAAELGYYFFLALFPALLFLISLLPYLPVDGLLEEALQGLRAFAPPEVIDFLRRQIDQIAGGSRGGILTVGILGAIWSSSAAMLAIISTLNRAYDIEEWRPWWKTRLLAIALTLGLAVFVITSFTLVLAGSHIGRWMAGWLGLSGAFVAVWPFLQWPLVFLLIVLAIDLIYYLAPNADTEWVWVTPGSLVATGLWILASLGFKLYVNQFGAFNATYGTIGGVIALLLWLYLSGLAILVGAELNSEIDAALSRGPEQPTRPGERKKIGPAAERVRRDARRSGSRNERPPDATDTRRSTLR